MSAAWGDIRDGVEENIVQKPSNLYLGERKRIRLPPQAPLTQNQKDIALLQNDPGALVLRIQGSVLSIVAKYIASGMFSPAERDDVTQAVMEELLRRMPRVQKNYDGRALLTTYLSAIIRNICLQMHKDRKIDIQPLESLDFEDVSGTNRPLEQLVLQDAINGYREIVELYHCEKSRIIVLARIHFRLPLDEMTLLWAYPKSPKSWRKSVLQVLGSKAGELKEREIYGLAAPFLNSIERNTTSADGYRHWMRERIPQLVDLLRRRLGSPTFGVDSFQLLLETMSLQSWQEP